MNKLIETLQHKNLAWHGAPINASFETESTGFKLMDERLGGGFLKTGVIEVLCDIGIGEFRFLLSSMKGSQSEDKLIVLISPPGEINASMMVEQGIELSKILILTPKSHKNRLWAAEQCLKNGVCHSVLMWNDEPLEIHQIKRLQIASAEGGGRQFIFRQFKAEGISLPVDLSFKLSANPMGLNVKINKRKRGWPSEEFSIDMSEQWPSLVIKEKLSNVISLQQVKAV